MPGAGTDGQRADMTIALPSWTIPTLLTAVIMIVAYGSMPEMHGDYDFTSGFVGLLSLAGGVILSLLVWIACLAIAW